MGKKKETSELLECRECRKRLPRSEYRNNQLDNPRPQCNACATDNALAMFANNMAMTTNARIIRNNAPPEKSNSDAHKPDSPKRKEEEEEGEEEKQPSNLSVQSFELPPAKRDRNRIPEGSRGRYLSYKHWCTGCKLESQNVLRCSRCKVVYFCSDICQKRTWSTHKTSCVPPLSGQELETAIQAFDLLPKDFLSLPRQITESDISMLEMMETRVMAWTSDDTIKSSIGKIGIFELLLSLLDQKYSSACHLRVLMLLAPLLEQCSVNVKRVVAIGGIAKFIENTLNDDPRIVVAATALLGGCISTVPWIADVLYRLGATIELWYLCSAKKHGLLQSEMDALICLQSTGVLIQVFERNSSEMVDAMTPMRIPSVLVFLLKFHKDMEILDNSTGSPIGNHLMINVLTLIGRAIYTPTEELIKEAFVDASLPSVIFSIISPTWERKDTPVVEGNILSRTISKIWEYILWYVTSQMMNPEVCIEYAERSICLLPALIRIPKARREFEAFNGVAMMLNLVQTKKWRLIPGAFDVLFSYIFSHESEYVKIINQVARTDLVPTLHYIFDEYLDDEDNGSIEPSLCQHITSEAVKILGLLAYFGKAPTIQNNLCESRYPQVLAHIIIHQKSSVELTSCSVSALANIITNASDGINVLQSVDEEVNHALETKLNALLHQGKIDNSCIEELVRKLKK